MWLTRSIFSEQKQVFICKQWQKKGLKLCECEWKLGNIRFYNPQKFLFVNQEIHIYFVIKCQACGWFLNLVVHKGLQWIKGYHLEYSNIKGISGYCCWGIWGEGTLWVRSFFSVLVATSQQAPKKQKQFLNRYLHKGNHKIQCFCILCYVTVQFCVLYYTVWLQDFCAL